MKTINIAAIVILGFALISDEKNSIDAPEVCIPTVEPVTQTEKEVVVVQNEPTTDNFSRPRKPCPPSGPGRR
jgi:hypothetical protein